MLAWNRACAAVFGDFGAVPIAERNIIWLMFTDPGLRTLIDEWERHARRVVAQFRVSFSHYPGDSWFRELIDRTLAASPEFRAWWPEHDVRYREPDRWRSSSARCWSRISPQASRWCTARCLSTRPPPGSPDW